MTYPELLQQNEWHQKCQEILDRDMFRCQDCGCIGFHNKAGAIRLKSIEELDSFFPDWTYDGQPISKIVESLDSIEFGKIDTFKDEQLFSIYQNAAQVVKIEKLLGKNTESFNHPRAFYNFMMAYDGKQELSSLVPIYGYTVTDIIRITHIPKINSRISYLKFEKQIAKNPFVFFSGNNSVLNNEYKIGISYDHYFIHLSFITDELLYKGLNIHHNYYIRGKRPWEYPNADALVTLCEDCHKERHEKDIPLHNLDNNEIKYLCKCRKCDGSGYIPQYWYRDNGVCYDCWGEGIILNDELLLDGRRDF